MSQWQDLVKYTCSIHETSPNVPRVILVSDLHNYYCNEDNDITRLAHMLCACLHDAISYCSRVYNSSSYLTISTQDGILETHKLSAMYFSSATWISNVVEDDQVVFCKKQLHMHQQRSCIIKFSKVNNKLRCNSVELLYMWICHIYIILCNNLNLYSIIYFKTHLF